MKNHLAGTCLALCLAIGSLSAAAQQLTGHLVVDIKPFASEVPLKKKVESQLQSGGIEWGAKDGQVVFTMVNKQYVNFEISHFTRYGTRTEVDLPAGDYALTGVGIVPSTSFSVEKMLAKGAYVNEKVLTLHVEAGKTTTISISPVIKKNATFFINFWMPELLTTISSEGAAPEAAATAVASGTAETGATPVAGAVNEASATAAPGSAGISILARTDKSIAWPAYSGSLKFVAP